MLLLKQTKLALTTTHCRQHIMNTYQDFGPNCQVIKDVQVYISELNSGKYYLPIKNIRLGYFYQ